MRITDATLPSRGGIWIPLAALDALISGPLWDAGIVGKGHLDTMMRLSRYLWGKQVLEGDVNDWCITTGIKKHIFQV